MKMSTLVFAILTLASVVLMAPGCGEQESATPSSGDGLRGKLVLTGSSTVAPLAGEIAKRFEKLHPDVRVDVQTGGSSRGIADAKRGTADIGMSSRDLKDSETQGVQSHLLAIDGVCMLVHADNPIKDLTDQQVRDIYTGKITNWLQLGGSDRSITVINRADGRAEVEVVLNHLGLTPEQIKPDLIAGENQQGIKAVASDPGAITYMSVGASEYEANRGVKVKLLAWNGVPAGSETVASGRFPVSRSLILITKNQPRDLVTSFVDYATSDQVRDLVQEFGYVSVGR